MDFNNLSGIFIEADKFNYAESDEFEDRSLVNLGTPNESEFIIVSKQKSKEMVLCKVYNSEVLIDGRKEDSQNKTDQPWYAQLQVLRESILLKKLSHPTIIRFVGLNLYNNKVVFEQGAVDNDGNEDEDEEVVANPTLFLEYAQNNSIQELINRKNELDLKPVKRQICIIGITAAVRFLHRNNVAHRSLNPNSIWLDSDLYPKIFDFSHSRESLPDDFSTEVTKTVCGKVFYLAPEVFAGTLELKFLNALDIFALGRLIYLLVTGVEPFRHKEDQFNKTPETLLGVKLSSYQAEVFIPDTVSEQYKNLFEACWSNNPNERPSAEQIYDLIADNKDFFIDNFSVSDIQEISNYTSMIEEYEQQNQVKIPIYDAGSFSIDLVSETTENMFKSLNNIIDEDSVESNEEEFFTIIKKLAKTEEFYDKEYLPKVMKYVTEFLDKNSYAAKEFINIVFGKSTKKVKDITMGTIPKDSTVINISSTVKKICTHAFAGYENLKRVYIPDSVETIENEAFSNCKNLTYVYLPKSIKEENLGKGAFSGCTSLDHITIPEKLTIIKEETFKGNKSLTKITLNKNLKTIDHYAFSECDSLKTITIPDSVKKICKCAFKPCKNLNTIEFRKATACQIKLIKMGCKYSK